MCLKNESRTEMRWPRIDVHGRKGARGRGREGGNYARSLLLSWSALETERRAPVSPCWNMYWPTRQKKINKPPNYLMSVINVLRFRNLLQQSSKISPAFTRDITSKTVSRMIHCFPLFNIEVYALIYKNFEKTNFKWNFIQLGNYAKDDRRHVFGIYSTFSLR